MYITSHFHPQGFFFIFLSIICQEAEKRIFDSRRTNPSKASTARSELDNESHEKRTRPRHILGGTALMLNNPKWGQAPSIANQS
jgi:hypothetical protein